MSGLQLVIMPGDLSTLQIDGTVTVITGTELDTMDRVTFGGDTNAMTELVSDLISTREPAVAEVPGWAVLGRLPS